MLFHIIEPSFTWIFAFICYDLLLPLTNVYPYCTDKVKGAHAQLHKICHKALYINQY